MAEKFLSAGEAGQAKKKTRKKIAGGEKAAANPERPDRAVFPDDLDAEIRDLLEKKKKALRERDKRRELEELIESFRRIVKPTSDIGRELNTYYDNFENGERGGAGQSRAMGDPDADLCEILFCGFTEGDYSERSYFQMPVAFSGGFFVRTPVANILFDPGNGTITGLRELGVNVKKETDIVVASHYHPSARLDMHTIFNMLGGYCPGRAGEKDRKESRRVWLFSTEAVLEGRCGHPPVLIPSDRKTIQAPPGGDAKTDCFRTEPGACWKIAGRPGRVRVENPPGTDRFSSAISKAWPIFFKCPERKSFADIA